jgi:hypothetical protein
MHGFTEATLTGPFNSSLGPGKSTTGGPHQFKPKAQQLKQAQKKAQYHETTHKKGVSVHLLH